MARLSAKQWARIAAIGTGSSVAIAAIVVQHHEGFVPTPYKDPVGITTVCHGVTGKDVIVGKRYTIEECNALLARHLAISKAAVQKVIKTPLTVWQEAALIDFTYNVGESKLQSSTLSKRFNSGDYYGGCMELLKWNKGRVGGELVVLNGLNYRRQDDLELCVMEAAE